jgi:hypothetical protein
MPGDDRAFFKNLTASAEPEAAGDGRIDEGGVHLVGGSANHHLGASDRCGEKGHDFLRLEHGCSPSKIPEDRKVVHHTSSFEDGIGEFYDQEIFAGHAIFVRFIFSDTTENAFRLEQAFSNDGGRSWEANWIARFNRS